MERYFETVAYQAFPFQVVETPEAAAIREEVEGLRDRCRLIVAVGGAPSAVRLVAGEAAGEVGTVNVIAAAFVLDRHNLRHEDLLGVLQVALGHHRNAKGAAWLRTVNPFYWLDMTLSVAEILPFLPIRLVGRDVGPAMNSVAGLEVRAFLRLAALGGLVWMTLALLGLDDRALALVSTAFRRISHPWQ
jgi:hypothetical protein